MEVVYNEIDLVYEIEVYDPVADATETLNFDSCTDCYLYMECTELSCKVKNMHSSQGDSLAMYGPTPILAQQILTLPNCQATWRR